MRLELPKKLLSVFTHMAQTGEGREVELGGDNRSIEITVLSDDVLNYPEAEKLVGGTIRIILNKKGNYVGHKLIGRI